jgi:hypothetical protein
MSLIRTPLAVGRPDPKHRQDCVAFIDGISQRNGIKLAPFDLTEWGRGAESTLIQSNISSRHPRMEARDLALLTDHSWGTLRSTDPGDFDCSFFKMAFDIRQKHSPFMTFGRTQKFINMLCKYAYCFYWGGMDARWNAQNTWVESLSPYFHIPVDSVVLFNLRTESPAWFARLITTPTVVNGRKYARFRHGDRAIGWSGLDRVYPYLAVQQYIIDNLHGSVSPMHREIRSLWVQ